MIVDALIIMITGLIQALFSLLPAWDMRQIIRGPSVVGEMYTPSTGYFTIMSDANHGSPLDSYWSSMWQLNKFIPVAELVAIMTIAASIWAGILLYKAIRYTIGVIRGSGTA